MITFLAYGFIFYHTLYNELNIYQFLFVNKIYLLFFFYHAILVSFHYITIIKNVPCCLRGQLTNRTLWWREELTISNAFSVFLFTIPTVNDNQLDPML